MPEVIDCNTLRKPIFYLKRGPTGPVHIMVGVAVTSLPEVTEVGRGEKIISK